ncbi:hypothetical protein AAY473_010208 [Plecturocebus cupreus]
MWGLWELQFKHGRYRFSLSVSEEKTFPDYCSHWEILLLFQDHADLGSHVRPDIASPGSGLTVINRKPFKLSEVCLKKKKKGLGQVQWLMPVISALWETEAVSQRNPFSEFLTFHLFRKYIYNYFNRPPKHRISVTKNQYSLQKGKTYSQQENREGLAVKQAEMQWHDHSSLQPRPPELRRSPDFSFPEMGFCHVTQAAFQLLGSNDHPSWIHSLPNVTLACRLEWSRNIIAYCSLNLPCSSNPPTLASPVTGTTGVRHHAWITFVFFCRERVLPCCTGWPSTSELKRISSELFIWIGNEGQEQLFGGSCYD